MTIAVATRPTDGIGRLAAPDPDTLPAETRATIRANGGENWAVALSANPATLRRFAGYFHDLFDPAGGLLPLPERELLAVVVSVENGCGYCEVHHTRALGVALGDPERAQRLALDWHLVPLSAREQALVKLARKLTHAPKTVAPADFQALRDLGLADDAILEAVEIAAWFNHTNRITIALGVQPDAHFFGRAAR